MKKSSEEKPRRELVFGRALSLGEVRGKSGGDEAFAFFVDERVRSWSGELGLKKQSFFRFSHKIFVVIFGNRC